MGRASEEDNESVADGSSAPSEEEMKEEVEVSEEGVEREVKEVSEKPVSGVSAFFARFKPKPKIGAEQPGTQSSGPSLSSRARGGVSFLQRVGSAAGRGALAVASFVKSDMDVKRERARANRAREGARSKSRAPFSLSGSSGRLRPAVSRLPGLVGGRAPRGRSVGLSLGRMPGVFAGGKGPRIAMLGSKLPKGFSLGKLKLGGGRPRLRL